MLRWEISGAFMVLTVPPVVLLVTSALAFFAGRWSNALRKPNILKDVAAEVQPHLYSPPPMHGEVEVPSIVKDVRGEVHNLRIGGFRFNVLVSEKDTLRSGDVHRSDQLDMIFSGNVRVTTREHGKDVVREYKGGDFLVIPANTPHKFHFLNHTVMAEWWTNEAFECRYYTPYRTEVDASMRAATRTTGLVPEQISTRSYKEYKKKSPQKRS